MKKEGLEFMAVIGETNSVEYLLVPLYKVVDEDTPQEIANKERMDYIYELFQQSPEQALNEVKKEAKEDSPALLRFINEFQSISF